jgi:hypothetical protein
VHGYAQAAFHPYCVLCLPAQFVFHGR